MKQEKNDVTVVKNLFWKLAEKWGIQIASLIVSVILSRLLDPKDFGEVSLAMVFVNVFSIFVDLGLGSSLIQKKDADDLDFSTVFITNIVICLLLYSLLFVSAPLFASFYNVDKLTNIIRVSGLVIIISALKNVQHSYIAKQMMFRKFFFASLGGTIVASIVGVVLAFTGFGVWSLIIMDVTDCLVDTIIIWFSIKWRPKFMFSFNRLKSLFNFSIKLSLSSIIDTVYNKLQQLVLGKYYSTEDLAYYDKGENIPLKLTTSIDGAINTVLFSVLSKEQSDKERVKSITKKAITTNIYILTPVLFGIAAVADSMISVLFTDKWLFCIPYIRIFCIKHVFRPIHTVNLNAIKSIGRSDIFLKLEIYKKIIGLIVLVVTATISPMAMAYGTLLMCFVSQLINSYPNKKLIDYGYFEQIKDIAPFMVLGVVMALAVYSVQLMRLSALFTLIIQIFIGAIIYIGCSYVFKFGPFFYILDLIKQLLHRNDE